jgi:hypothetical protein
MIRKLSYNASINNIHPNSLQAWIGFGETIDECSRNTAASVAHRLGWLSVITAK